MDEDMDWRADLVRYHIPEWNGVRCGSFDLGSGAHGFEVSMGGDVERQQVAQHVYGCVQLGIEPRRVFRRLLIL